MSIDFLKNSSLFTEDGKGNYYTKTNNFLFTVTPDEEGVFLFINLPELDDNERKASSAFIKENVDLLSKVRIVKNGIKLTLNENVSEEAILKAIDVTSDYFTEKKLVFPEKHYDVVLKNHMYVLEENGEYEEEPETVAEEADTEVLDTEALDTENTEKADGKEDIKKSKFDAFIDKLPTQILLIAIYALCSLVFFLLSMISISLAAVTGYFMGWLATAVLVKRGHSHKKIFISVTLATLIAMMISGFYSFLFLFLTQQEIYTAFEFFFQSLSPLYCIFNITLGVLLSLFGMYSSLPAKEKKKKTDYEEDF